MIYMGTIENVSIREIDKYIGDGRYLIADVRSEADYQKSHIEGAVNISYKSIENGETELPRNKIIVLYCEHGGVSIMAAKKLYRRGYRVINTLGGFAAYEKM